MEAMMDQKRKKDTAHDCTPSYAALSNRLRKFLCNHFEADLPQTFGSGAVVRSRGGGN